MGDKTVTIVPFGAKNDPKVDKDRGQREIWEHGATNRVTLVSFGEHRQNFLGAIP